MSQLALRDTQTGAEIVPLSETGKLTEAIVAAARDASVDVEKLERLVAMKERLDAKDAERAFNIAMTAAQQEIRPVATDSTNPQTRSDYASYPALDKAIRPIYTKHGFSLSFDTGDSAPDMVRVLCYVAHIAGHTRTYKADMPADGKGAKGADVMTRTHATGAAFSYSQRYLLKLIFNVSIGDDDDGNAAAGDTISEAQRDTLQHLIGETGADPEKFCAYMKAASLMDIKTKDFGRAVEALNLKRKSVQK